MKFLDLILLILAILGGIDLAARGLQWLTSIFPKLLSVQAKLWRTASDVVSLPILRRRAIVTRVEEVLNQTAFSLRQHLPKGWIKRARISWIRKPQKTLFYDGELILRIRPEGASDGNLIRALSIYFESALFPDTKDLLPPAIVHAVSLAITRSSLEEYHPYLVAEFDKKFLEDVNENEDDFKGYLADFIRLNEYGLLMGPFIREIDNAVNMCRFRMGRENLLSLVKNVLQHMLGFQPLLRENKPECDWSYNGPVVSYGFLLVSRPPSIRPGLHAYVKRAQQQVTSGVQRLYIIGRNEERDFVARVITAILSIRELKGLELFTLFRDYRGEPDGMGALVAVDSFTAKLGLKSRIVSDDAMDTMVAQISNASSELDDKADQKSAAQDDLQRIVEDTIIQLSDFEGEWISLADFGSRIRQQIPGFSPERYGARNLVSVLKRLDGLEFDERGAGAAKAVYVRLSESVNGHPHSLDNEALYEQVIAIVSGYSQPDGWIFLGALGHHLKTHIENFSPKMLGEATLHGFVSKIPTLEVQERGDNHSKTYVRIRA